VALQEIGLSGLKEEVFVFVLCAPELVLGRAGLPGAGSWEKQSTEEDAGEMVEAGYRERSWSLWLFFRRTRSAA